MKRGTSFVIVGLVVAVSVALAPTVALAGRAAARSGGGHSGAAHATGGHFSVTGAGVIHVAPTHFGRPHVGHHLVVAHPGVRPFAGRHGFQHRAFVRHGVPVTAFAAAPFVYYAPPVAYGAPIYDAPPVYDEPPIAYSPPASGAISLAPSPGPSMPNVVQYATGRYELRGDGVTMPYTWVWVPNPPPAPPDASEPADPTPSRRSKLYRWTDEQGVVHLTDVRNAVPQTPRERE